MGFQATDSEHGGGKRETCIGKPRAPHLRRHPIILMERIYTRMIILSVEYHLQVLQRAIPLGVVMAMDIVSRLSCHLLRLFHMAVGLFLLHCLIIYTAIVVIFHCLNSPVVHPFRF